MRFIFGDTRDYLERLRCTGLLDLDCHDNPALTTLSLSECTELRKLDCGGAGLESLDLRNFTELVELNCSDNPSLQTLDISKSTSLQTLSCGNTQLSNLDVHGRKALITLACGNNALLTLGERGRMYRAHIDFLQ